MWDIGVGKTKLMTAVWKFIANAFRELLTAIHSSFVNPVLQITELPYVLGRRPKSFFLMVRYIRGDSKSGLSGVAMANPSFSGPKVGRAQLV